MTRPEASVAVPRPRATRRRLAGIGLCLLLTGVLSSCALNQGTAQAAEQARRIMVTLLRPELQAPGVLAFSGSAPASTGSLTARLPTRELSRRIARAHDLKVVDSWGIDALGVEVYVFEAGRDSDLEGLVQVLRNAAQVDSVQVVNDFRTLAYNDPYFYLQEAGKSDSIERIHAYSTGKGIKVGIVDTGVDRRHPEFRDRIVYAGNFVAHDQQHFDTDLHGTAVAGVIAASANNDQGIVGVAPAVGLMVFKACWQQEMLETRCDSASLVKALGKVLELRPDVVNLSLSGPEDPLVRRMIGKAAQQGIVLVGAVDQRRGLEGSFPANMDEVIAVAATPGDAGRGGRHGLIAPGIDVLTTAPEAGYAFESGSSMATAHVSGIVALLKEKEPSLAGAGVQELLNHTARVADAERIVDMCAALMRVRQDTICASNLLVRNRDLPEQQATN